MKRHFPTVLGIAVWMLAALPVAGEDLQPVDAFEQVPAIPASDRNPWPPAWEKALRQRLRDYLDRWEYQPPVTMWQSEKSGGGFLAFLKLGR